MAAVEGTVNKDKNRDPVSVMAFTARPSLSQLHLPPPGTEKEPLRSLPNVLSGRSIF